MAKKKKIEKLDDPETDYIIEEVVVTYTRKRRLFKFLCSLENCPYCRNEPQTARHPSKKWCTEDARAEFRRRERARIAIENQRNPGVLGKPAELDNKRIGVFYIHILDKPKRLDGTNIYRVGSTATWNDYEEQYLMDNDLRQSFDAVIITLTYQPEALAEKIVRKNEDKQQENGWFHLSDPDVRIAHQIVIEHIEVYEQSEENQ
jgi:hypothetical protein